MSERTNRIALNAYLMMREAKEIELRTFKSTLAAWPDNPQSQIRQGIADLVDTLRNDLAVLNKLIKAWDADAREWL